MLYPSELRGRAILTIEDFAGGRSRVGAAFQHGGDLSQSLRYGIDPGDEGERGERGDASAKKNWSPVIGTPGFQYCGCRAIISHDQLGTPAGTSREI